MKTHYLKYLFFSFCLLSHGFKSVFASDPRAQYIKNKSSGFIENKGQIIDQNSQPNPAVLYLLNSPGLNVQLRRGGFSYDVYQVHSQQPAASSQEIANDSLHPASGIRHPASEIQHPVSSIQYHRIDIDLQNANPNPVIETSDPSPDYFNYYTAYVPVEGIKKVRQYGKVTYKDIYRGIDLEFFTEKEHCYKYNFVIHPGCNINDIRLNIAGPEHISLNRDTLTFGTRFGDVEELIPESYYQVNDSKIEIRVHFQRITEGAYGFSTDRTIPENSILIIDPTAIRLWGTYYGGLYQDMAGDCSVDNFGNIFLTGQTDSYNNIATAGSYQETYAGLGDAFLVKFNADGQRQWGTYIGGTDEDGANSCVTDISDNIYISGVTASVNGIASTGAHQTVYGGGSLDCFIEKFNEEGFRLWGTYYGGTDNDELGIVTVDKAKNVFLAGQTYSTNGIATPGSYQENLSSTRNAFLAKFDSNGVRQWGTYYGGEAGTATGGYCCTTDNSGNVYFGGTTDAQSGIASPGAFQTTYGGMEDAFLAKFTTGGQRLWSTYYGGTLFDIGYGCITDSAEDVIIAGQTDSPNGIASTGCHQPNLGGNYDAYLVKFDSSGQRQWGTYYGGADYEGASGPRCTIGYNDDIFMVGSTLSNNNISTLNSYQQIWAGGLDAFLVKFNAAGQRQWGTYYGGSANDGSAGCSYVRDDTIYLFGFTWSATNIASPGSFQEVLGGYYDCMLIKFLDCWPIDTAGPITGPVSVCVNTMGLSYSIPTIAHAVHYAWTLPPGVTLSSGAGTISIIADFSSSASSGNILVKGLNKCGDPGDSAFLYVAVHQRPVPVISGNDTTCSGPGKIYSTTPGNINYQWSISSGGVITAGGTSTDNSITVTWNSSGLQTVQVNYTDTNGCAGLTPAQFNVFVILGPPVSISINASANNICSGTSVIFTATPVNGGTNPGYQWKINGVNAGTNAPALTYNPASGDLVSCILTSNDTCSSNNPATSNTITMIVNPVLPVSVNIAPSVNPSCAGNSVTFTATPTNGGSSPSYQWKVNGINAGTNSPNYSYIPNNGDIATCVLTSNALCTIGNPAMSNSITMTINPNLPVSVYISASANPFCQGSSVTFTANPTNGGTSPSYQWKVNGINVGTNSPTYSYIPLNVDLVSCELTSNIPCPIANPVTSNIISMITNNNLPAGVSITASTNPFCPGNSVTFTASPVNGGTNPAYQWKVNGVNAGTNSSTFSYNPVNGDSVRCVMTSNLACVSGNPASSNKIIMSGTLAPVVSFTRCNDSITTVNAQPFRLKGGIPLGGTYSGPGVTNGIFYPAIAGVGTHQINYTYTNAALCTVTDHRSLITINPAPFTCGNPVTDIRDNKVYPTVQIGSQCWMAEDLNYGTEIPADLAQRDNCLPEKYHNPASSIQHPASVYQWDELMQYDEVISNQGLCPPGWHIPTEADWNALFANYINNAFAASPLKYSGFSGFNALLSGARHMNKSWDFQGFATFFWSSTAHGNTKVWAHGMNDVDPSVSLYPAYRNNAFSVRCLKD